MERANPVITVTAMIMLLFSTGSLSENKPVRMISGSVQAQTKPAQTGSKSVQTKTKSSQTVKKPAPPVQVKTKPGQSVSKPAQVKTKPAQKSPAAQQADKGRDIGTVTIGTQTWAVANLNVSTFRNGDSIPEAKTNEEWVKAGESGTPVWCYYNNDPANGQKYGKLYNWYAVNDPRGLAPAGWKIPGDADWAKLMFYLGGPDVSGNRMKSTSGWANGNIGNNESGFTGLAGGYRVENGIFLNLGSIGTWWSSTEGRSLSAVDYYLSLTGSLGRSSSPRQRGESVRCLRN